MATTTWGRPRNQARGGGEALMASPKRLARIAGLLYLIVAIFGGFAIGYVRPLLYAPGDAATTAANVVANTGLVRIGVVADLLQATVFVFLGMTLYLLLKHVHKNAATAMVVLVAIATTLMCLDKVFQFAALRVATDASYAAAFGAAGSNALVLLLLDIHNYGFLIAQIFFGLWLVPLGYLAYKSGMFPKALGVVLIVGRPLSGGPVRAVHGPRRRRANPRFPGHPAHDRGDLDGRLPARQGCERVTPSRSRSRRGGARSRAGVRGGRGHAVSRTRSRPSRIRSSPNSNSSA